MRVMVQQAQECEVTVGNDDGAIIAHGVIHCGGVEISPGDLIVGDDDGVIAVPLGAVTDDLLARCRARLAREADGSNE